MTETVPQKPENSRQETEMPRVDAIRDEMATAVRLIGESGRNAAEENWFAARMTGLPVTVIERLRWKKIKRVPADVADAIRDALIAHTKQSEARGAHERRILEQRLQALAAIADSPSDPDFYRSQVAGVVEQARRFDLLDSAGAKGDG